MNFIASTFKDPFNLTENESDLLSEIIGTLSPCAMKPASSLKAVHRDQTRALDFLKQKKLVAQAVSRVSKCIEVPASAVSAMKRLDDALDCDPETFDDDDHKAQAAPEQEHTRAHQKKPDGFIDPTLSVASLPTKDAKTKVVSSVQRGTHTEKALHRACQLFPTKKSMVEASLRLDPSAISRKAFIDCIPSQTRKYQEAIQKNFPRRRPKAPEGAPEPFQLPINIALYHGASLEVLDLLVHADPSQLSVKDGIHGINTLCLALDRRPNDVACLGLLLSNNREAVKAKTEMCENFPLHVACQKCASLQVIKMLVQLHPLALIHRNANGYLPVDIVRRLQPTGEVLDFLTLQTSSVESQSVPASYPTAA